MVCFVASLELASFRRFLIFSFFVGWSALDCLALDVACLVLFWLWRLIWLCLHFGGCLISNLDNYVLLVRVGVSIFKLYFGGF